MSSVVTDISPATVTIPSAKVIKSVSSVCPMVVPFIITLSIVAVVIAGWRAGRLVGAGD